MSTFEGRPLVLGSIHGTRSFEVDQLGRLVAPSQKSIWTPGENVAKCRGRVIDPKNHTSFEDCSHGFYAYYDGTNDYERSDTVSAVIEGYGETQIGDKGFRSEKAKIVGLHLKPKHKVKDPLYIKPVRFYQNLEDNYEGWFIFACIATGVTAFLSLMGTLISYLPSEGVNYPTLGMIFAIILGIAAINGLFLIYSANTTKYNWRDYDPKQQEQYANGYDKIARNYPDVKIFKTYESMMDGFDIMTTERKLRELTPDHSDFWEIEL